MKSASVITISKSFITSNNTVLLHKININITEKCSIIEFILSTFLQKNVWNIKTFLVTCLFQPMSSLQICAQWRNKHHTFSTVFGL